VKRPPVLAVLAAGWILATPTPGLAQWDIGVRGGVYVDSSDFFLGLEGLTRIKERWYFNPNVEFVAVEDGDLVTLNADVHYDLPADVPVYVWVGGGPAIVVRDREAGPPGRGDGGDTEPGLNLLAGVGFNKRGTVTPYLQGKILLSDGSEAVLAFGVRF